MKQVISLFFIGAIFLIIALSCKKQLTETAAYFKVINASANSGAIVVKLNDDIFGANISYGDNAFYQSAVAGVFNLKVTDAGNTNAILNINSNLQALKFYSFYLYDSLTKLKLSILEDDQSLPPAGKAYIRFLHLSSDGRTVDLVRTIDTLKLYTSRRFQDQFTTASYKSYKAVDAGMFNYKTVVANTDTLVSSLPLFRTVAGARYTFILQGFTSATATNAAYIKLSAFEDKP